MKYTIEYEMDLRKEISNKDLEIIDGNIRLIDRSIDAYDKRVYDAIYRLISKKKDRKVFIPYYILHEELGYTMKYRGYHRRRYQETLCSLRNIVVTIRWLGFSYVSEPLVIWLYDENVMLHDDTKDNKKANGNDIKREGFYVMASKLMRLKKATTDFNKTLDKMSDDDKR